jgi:hypothetical protein
MEAIYPSETLVSTYKSTRPYYTEDQYIVSPSWSWVLNSDWRHHADMPKILHEILLYIKIKKKQQDGVKQQGHIKKI